MEIYLFAGAAQSIADWVAYTAETYFLTAMKV